MKVVLEAGRPGLEAAVEHMETSFNIHFYLSFCVWYGSIPMSCMSCNFCCQKYEKILKGTKVFGECSYFFPTFSKRYILQSREVYPPLTLDLVPLKSLSI